MLVFAIVYFISGSSSNHWIGLNSRDGNQGDYTDKHTKSHTHVAQSYFIKYRQKVYTFSRI